TVAALASWCHGLTRTPTRRARGRSLGARVGSRRQLGDRADAPPGGAQWRQPGVVAELRAPSLETWGRALAAIRRGTRARCRVGRRCRLSLRRRAPGGLRPG